jgi:hypothetical protein
VKRQIPHREHNRLRTRGSLLKVEGSLSGITLLGSIITPEEEMRLRNNQAEALGCAASLLKAQSGS